jgi:hypothetical protein
MKIGSPKAPVKPKRFRTEFHRGKTDVIWRQSKEKYSVVRLEYLQQVSCLVDLLTEAGYHKEEP